MSSVRFWVADVFTDSVYKGNPLAIVDNWAGDLSDEQMRLITRQFNLSETTFFSKPTDGRAAAKLRSFLPDGREVFGAGHNILGAWWFLTDAGMIELPDSAIDTSGTETEKEYKIYQQLGDNVTPLRISKDASKTFVKLRQATPQAHAEHPDPAGLAASIGLRAEDIGLTATSEKGESVTLPPQVMSTATTHHLLVPLSSVEALGRVSVQRDTMLAQLIKADKRAYGLFLFAQVGPSKFQARFFSPGMSSEDPATGSAAGPLSAYLHNHGLLELKDGKADIEVHQGQFVGRDCVIRVQLSRGKDGAVEVDLLGSGVTVSQGTMVAPRD